ncbi:MAG: choice-of-anchor P family protein [Haloechinothrix sp.]
MSRTTERWWVSAAVGGFLVASLTGLSGSAVAADEPETSGAGSVGAVDVVYDGEEIVVDPIAECAVPGRQTNRTSGVSVGDVARYGRATTNCRWDSAGNALVEVAGRTFSTRALVEWGGPRIRISSFTVNCQTTGNGSAASFELRGIRGIEVPDRIPSNYTVTIPGRIEGSAPLAKVVLNELIAPSPPDGSMTLNAMRIELFPEGGGPNSGDITVGTVACDPFGT